MSYDIAFKVRVADTNKYVTVGDCDANITWNVRPIIEKSTGLPWLNEENNGYCVDIMPAIQRGLDELRSHPNKYKKFEAENGWEWSVIKSDNVFVTKMQVTCEENIRHLLRLTFFIIFWKILSFCFRVQVELAPL